MAEDYRYSDDGNHQMWTDSHQGSGYSRVNRIHRFFVGSKEVLPSVGGDSFRVDSHAAHATTQIGEQILDLSDAGASRVSTIAVVEDEHNGFGRYFCLEYDSEGGAMVPKRVKVYDSDYTAELEAVTVEDSWTPFVQLLPYVEQGMRVINLGGAEKRTFLFYLVPGPLSTKVNMVALPDPGVAASSAPPTEVIDLSFIVRDRIYVVQDSPSSVFLYIGDTERSPTQRTMVIRYDVDSKTVTDNRVVVDGATPFPRSNTAARGRRQQDEVPVHLVIEPQSSWADSAGTNSDDFPSVDSEHAPLFRHTTGNAWKLLTVNQNGFTVEDTVTFEGSDIKPWLSGAEADAQGGQVRVAAVPRYLTRVSPPPEAYAALQSIPDEDTSDVYIVHAAAMIRYQGIIEDDSFVYRQGQDDLSVFYRNVYGNSRSVSNVFEGNPPDLDTTNRRDTTILVPGTILIENAQSIPVSDLQPYRTIGTVANRLDAWRLEDNSTFHGEPYEGAESDTGIAPTDWDPSTDTIHGVQGDVFDEDRSIVVGWFTNGFLPV